MSADKDTWLDRFFCGRIITEREASVQAEKTSSDALVQLRLKVIDLEKEKASIIASASTDKQADLLKIDGLNVRISELQAQISQLQIQLNQQSIITPTTSPQFGNLPESTRNLALGYMNKYPEAFITYEGRYFGADAAKQRYRLDIKAWLMEGQNDREIISMVKNAKARVSDVLLEQPSISFHEACDIAFMRVCHALGDSIPYQYDQRAWGDNEFWQFSSETAVMKTGDCLPLSTEIYNRNGLITVGELKVGDEVLSYDFERKEYCYKPVVKIWEKGELPVKKIRFRNGHELLTTNDHPFWCRRNQKGNSEYLKTPLGEIDLTRWWVRKIPCVKKLPYEVKDVAWLTTDLCFVAGHFIAEGWVGNSHVCTSGYDCDQITEILEKYGIPFSEGKNGGGVPIINFLKSDFKNFLATLKKNSFDIHLPEWMLHLPEEKLQSFVDGHFLGDGNIIPEYAIPFGKSYSSLNWSTSSEELAYALNRIFLQLGKPVYFWKQEHHGGVGKQPIWRLRYKERSAFCQEHGYAGLSEVSISYTEDAGTEIVRDFEVADTHSFVFKNGIIGHNCEDKAIMNYVGCRIAGIPWELLRVTAGLTYSNEGHCTSFYLASDLRWHHRNSTTNYPADKSAKSLPLTGDSSENLNIKNPWFSMTETKTFNWFGTEAERSDAMTLKDGNFFKFLHIWGD